PLEPAETSPETSDPTGSSSRDAVPPAPSEEDASEEELTAVNQIFDPIAHLEAVRKIDGASEDDDEPDLPSEATEEDPISYAGSLRWMMRVDGFGITDWEWSTADHRPRFSDHTRFNLGVPFTIHFIDEVQALGLPSELYDAQIETRLIQPIGDVWGVDLAVTPAFFSDFDSGSNNGLRMTGHGMATLMLSDEWQFALGVMYLGREDVRLLPAGGVVWNISDGTKLELLMPKPRISQLVHANEDYEQFAYTGFELWGGNSWDITRPDDTFDTFTYRDFRFVVGLETRSKNLLRGVFEIGYVFARKLEFRHDPTILEPGDTLMLRLGSNY
ncbi:MAG: hypothetical protein AB7O26_15460, partial [Planctomycetaceae bacterium]